MQGRGLPPNHFPNQNLKYNLSMQGSADAAAAVSVGSSSSGAPSQGCKGCQTGARDPHPRPTPGRQKVSQTHLLHQADALAQCVGHAQCIITPTCHAPMTVSQSSQINVHPHLFTLMFCWEGCSLHSNGNPGESLMSAPDQKDCADHTPPIPHSSPMSMNAKQFMT